MAARWVFLGRLGDLAGQVSATVPTPLDWAGVLALLPADLAQAVAAPRVRVARNGVVLADKTTLVLSDGDEVAFLPPVSGG